MSAPRRPVPPMEELTHAGRTRARTVSLKHQFFMLPISGDAQRLLLTLAYFVDISTYEVNLLSLTYHTGGYGPGIDDLLLELDSIPDLCFPSRYGVLQFNEDRLKLVGIKIIDRHRIHREAADRGLSPEETETYNKATEVLQAYNLVRGEFYSRSKRGFVPPPIKFTGATRNAAHRVTLFCKNHQIDDYELYFYTLCYAKDWSVLPYLQHCHQPWSFDSWFKYKDEVKALLYEKTRLDKQKAVEKKDRDTGKKKSIFRDLFETVERTKLAYKMSRQVEVCMNSFGDTYGYHPKSSICKSCAVREACMDKLDGYVKEISKDIIDVIALRSGNAHIVDIQRKLKASGVDLDVYDGSSPSARARIEGRIGGKR